MVSGISHPTEVALVAPPPTAGPATMVGDATCASCHPREYAMWGASNHERAMQPADASTVLGKFDGRTIIHAGIASRFYQRDGKFLVRTDGPQGALQEYEVRYTFGVSPLQQYLVALPGGRLQALELAWDTRPRQDGGQRWFHLYPKERDHERRSPSLDASF